MNDFHLTKKLIKDGERFWWCLSFLHNKTDFFNIFYRGWLIRIKNIVWMVNRKCPIIYCPVYILIYSIPNKSIYSILAISIDSFYWTWLMLLISTKPKFVNGLKKRMCLDYQYKRFITNVDWSTIDCSHISPNCFACRVDSLCLL